MLRVEIDLKDNTIYFQCPNCSAQDIIYLRQPEFCCRCNTIYNFDVPMTLLSRETRTKYHFNGINIGE